jgi:hypothetical protein
MYSIHIPGLQIALLIYIPAWPNNIEILILKEFDIELNRYPEIIP